jgi:hypothetical protein
MGIRPAMAKRENSAQAGAYPDAYGASPPIPVLDMQPLI